MKQKEYRKEKRKKDSCLYSSVLHPDATLVVGSWFSPELHLSEGKNGERREKDGHIEINLALRHSRTSPTPELHHDEGSKHYLLTPELHHDVGNIQKETKHPLHQSCIMM